MVALAITTILFLAALAMMAVDQKVYNREDATLEAAREGRHALETLEADLLMAGYQTDVRTVADLGPDGTANTDDDLLGQPEIVLAAPWEIVFNADIDPEVAALRDGASGDSLPSGYAPVTFFTGAETIRYTLDSNGDGSVTAADRGDEAEEAAVDNNGLFLLRREIYGSNSGTNTVDSGPVALVRGPSTYPSGARPTPMFLYWGHFDSDAALDLWGDDGSGGGTAGNGVLESGELAALGPVTVEDADGDATLDSGEDRNGNGSLERTITELIHRVDIHVTAETSYPDMDWEDPDRSASGSPFRYRVVTLNTQIEPRNLELPGGACGDEPDPTDNATVVNACSHALADGKVRVTWDLSADDTANEQDIERYLIFRTNVNSIFGPTPFTEVNAGTGTWDDDWMEARTWPPRQYWYRVRAMDCTPHMSLGDPTAGPYPADVGPMYPPHFTVNDVPGDDGTNLDVLWEKSPDDPTNTTGYGGDLKDYHVYRSTLSDYRCQAPVNNSAVTATGAATYSFQDNATNSTSGLTYGELYYYWLRSRDGSDNMSPYSPRSCARSYKGPTFPVDQRIRVADYGSSDHPVEVWFSPNDANTSAGYDPYQLTYRIYRAPDLTGDGQPDSVVDHPLGYTTDDRAADLPWSGTLWTLGDAVGCGFHSIDGGSNWRNLADLPVAGALAADFGSRLHGVAVGAAGAIQYSHNGGISFTAAATSVMVDLFDVAFIDAKRVVAVGQAGTALYSSDAGATWANGSTGVATDLLSVAAEDDVVVAVGDSGVVLVSTDGGANWVSTTGTPGEDLVGACVLANGSTILAGGDDQVWRSDDGGATWTSSGLPGSPGQVEALDCVASGAAIALAPSSSQPIYESADGVTFANAAPSPTGDVTAVGLLDQNVAWIVDDLGNLYSRDTAGTWTSSIVDSTCILRDVVVRPEIVWEDSTTASAASGSEHHYVVTTSYDVGDATLDGECGLLPDQPASDESPDDSLDQVLVDACKDIELSVVVP
jgi:photosystem II stability/assembly factor-like uncharacterized protein